MQIFLTRNMPGYTPPTIRGAWDDTAGSVTAALSPVEFGGGNITSVAVIESSTMLGFSALLYRGISAPMAAQTLTGNFDVVLGVNESNASANMVYHIHVYVTQGDTDNVRGTLINDYIDGTEWPTAAAGRALDAPQAYGPLNVTAGDRIVVEIGYSAQNVSSTNFSGTLRYGTSVTGTPAAPLQVGSTGITLFAGSISFDSAITFLGPAAPGWSQFQAGLSSVTTGATSLVLPRPSGTENGDILLAFLSHKGAGFATAPAGWAIVAQDVHGGSGIRGEVWWKRADNEPDGSYTFTGLADTATGFIRGYQGALAAGDPIDVALTATGSSNQPIVNTPFTPAAPDALCIFMVAAAANNSVGTYRFGNNDIQSPAEIADAGTTTGTDCRIAAANAVLHVPNEIEFARASISSTRWVAIAITLLPQTGAATLGTRYYPSKNGMPLHSWVQAPPQGTWTRAADTGTDFNLPRGFWTYELAQSKNGGGSLQERAISTDQEDDTILHTRWVTPLLDAQTISGTFDLSFAVRSTMNDSSVSPLDSYKVRWVVHAYISVGDTNQVRHTLLNNYVDTIDWSSGNVPVIRQGLATPQSLTSGVCMAGDRVVVEIGIWNRELPIPTPLYPPATWGFANVRYVGTSNGITGVPWIDGAQGDDRTFTCSWLDFSHTFVEQALPSGPTNIDPGSAIVIAALPYADPAQYPTRTATSVGRAVWYEYVCLADERVFITTLGSNYAAEIEIFNSLDLTVQAAEVIDIDGDNFSGVCDWLAIADLVGGNTYYIRVATAIGTTTNGQASGGAVRLTMSAYSAPAEDDLYVPAVNVYALRDGVIVNATSRFRNALPTGIALDFSGIALPDFNDPSYPTPTNVNPKVYLGTFFGNGSGTLVEIVDGLTLNVGDFLEVNFISEPFEDNGAVNLATVDVTTSDNKLLAGLFGNGFQYVNGSSQLSLAAFFNNISDPQGVRDGIQETPVDNVDNPGPPALATAYAAAPEKTAPWHIRVNQADEDEIYYVSGAEYVTDVLLGNVPVELRATEIRRWSRTSGQLSAFATVPLATGSHEGLYGIDSNPNGDVLVCNGNRVDRLDATGTVVQSYTPNVAELSYALVAVRYTHDATKFWVFDMSSGTLWQFDVASGAILQQVDTYFSSVATFQMAIWLPSGITPPTEGTLIVVKRLVDSDDFSTEFTIEVGGGLSPATIALAQDEMEIYSGVSPASGYSVAEPTQPAGWELVSIVVSNGDPADNISVAAGETVTVTVTNAPIISPDCPGDRSGSRTDGLPYSPPEVEPCAGSGVRVGARTGA